MVLYKIFQSFDKVTVERVLHCAYSPVIKPIEQKEYEFLKKTNRFCLGKITKTDIVLISFQEATQRLNERKR